MYGQFHNAQSIRTTKSFQAEKNIFVKTDSIKIKLMTFVSLIFICFSLASTSFAGASKPQLPGGNGNAQGR